jgi:ribosomal protein S18 acetylase RimI-like enzyme
VDVLIRNVRPDEVQALATLIAQLGYPTSEEAVARRVERFQASNADRLAVAEMDGQAVGLAGLHISLAVEYDDPVAKLSAIVVDERYKGRGIGRALVAEMEAEARRRGCCLIFLTTAERRKDAQSFYRQLGFEETGRRFAKRLG